MLKTTLAKRRRIPNHSGSILLMVLVAIIIMSLTTSTYLLLMRNEHLAARYSGNHLKTEMLTQSGLEYLKVFLTQSDLDIEQQGGLHNNPNQMQDVLVIDDSLANYRGRFTVVAPDMAQGFYQNVRYGLENESAKLNLNSLLAGDDSSSSRAQATSPRDRLMAIPGMNEMVADAILDWLDDDDSPRANGAEVDYYQSLTPAYEPRNGPIAHLDELLMIQGVTPELLYGLDTNRNYQIDSNELPRGALEELDNSLGQLNRGWSAYLTVNSSETIANPEGEAKIDLSEAISETQHSDLQQVLSLAEANFLIAYRQYGPADASATGSVISADSLEIDFEKEAENEITSLLDLVDARVLIEGSNGKPDQIVESPWTDSSQTYRQSFAVLLDQVAVDSKNQVDGRTNINLASQPVLMTIPGMTETLADQIIAQRDLTQDLFSGDQRHPTWLLADDLIDLEEFKPLMPYLTTRGNVYSAQVVGFFEAGTARARAQVLLRRSDSKTELLDWHDLSKLGPGFSLSRLSVMQEQIE